MKEGFGVSSHFILTYNNLTQDNNVLDRGLTDMHLVKSNLYCELSVSELRACCLAVEICIYIYSCCRKQFYILYICMYWCRNVHLFHVCDCHFGALHLCMAVCCN